MDTEEMKEAARENKTISIKLPQIKLPSLQAAILILLIAVGVLQTAQLYGLNLKITSGKVSTSTRSTSPAPGSSTAPAAGGSSLPSMVGGC